MAVWGQEVRIFGRRGYLGDSSRAEGEDIWSATEQGGRDCIFRVAEAVYSRVVETIYPGSRDCISPGSRDYIFPRSRDYKICS